VIATAQPAGKDVSAGEDADVRRKATAYHNCQLSWSQRVKLAEYLSLPRQNGDGKEIQYYSYA